MAVAGQPIGKQGGSKRKPARPSFCAAASLACPSYNAVLAVDEDRIVNPNDLMLLAILEI
jgi:hypothetical protein